MLRRHTADTLLFILLCSQNLQIGENSSLYVVRGAMQKALSVMGTINYIIVPLRDALTRVNAWQEAQLPTKASTILDGCIVINMCDADKIDARGESKADDGIGSGVEGRRVAKRSVHRRLVDKEAYLGSR